MCVANIHYSPVSVLLLFPVGTVWELNPGELSIDFRKQDIKFLNSCNYVDRNVAQ